MQELDLYFNLLLFYVRKSPRIIQKPIQRQFPRIIESTDQTLAQKLLRFALNSGAKLGFEKSKEGNMIAVVSFENTENLTEFLTQTCFLGDFVGHGSSILWEKSKPKQANCGEKKDGNLVGTYCAKEWIMVMFRALVGGINGKSPPSVNCIFNPVTQKFEVLESYFGFSGTPAQEGYLYLFPQEFSRQLKDNNGREIDEHLIEESCVPYLVVRITQDQFTNKFPIERIEN